MQTGIAKSSKEQVLGPKGSSGITMGFPRKGRYWWLSESRHGAEKVNLAVFSLDYDTSKIIFICMYVFICVYLCLSMYVVYCVYVHVHLHRCVCPPMLMLRLQGRVSYSITLHSMPLRRGLSLNPEVGWQPASPGDPCPRHHSTGVVMCVAMPNYSTVVIPIPSKGPL